MSAAAVILGGLATVTLLGGAGHAPTTGAIYPLGPRPAAAASARPTYRDTGPPLLFVDQEHVPGPGLLARARVSGAVRLFQYDQPGPGRRLRFAWVLRNPGTRPVAVTVTDQASAPPGRRYLPLAASVQRAFLDGSARQRLQVPPGGIRVLRDRATAPATAGELAFSIYDLRVAGSLEVLDVASAHLAGLGPGRLPSTYPGGGGIGALFPHDTRRLSARFTGTRRTLSIAAHDRQDPPLVARDLVTGRRNTDKGNYGVTYRVRLVLPPSPHRSAHLWVTAGGCALRADFRLGSGPQAGRVIQLPAAGDLPHGVLGAALDTLPLSPRAPSVLTFRLLPPAASCTPIRVREAPVNPRSLAVRLYQVPFWRWWTGL